MWGIINFIIIRIMGVLEYSKRKKEVGKKYLNKLWLIFIKFDFLKKIKLGLV